MKTTLEFASDSRGLTRIIISDPDFLPKCLSDRTFENAIVGSGSIYNVKTKTVYLYPSHLQEGTLHSCQSIARKIIENALRECGRRRYPNPQDFDPESLLSPPQYCLPTTGDLIYIDLKSAYFQIYQRMPMFPHKGRKNWNNAPPFLSDFLPPDLKDFKVVRNSIGGLWRATTTTKIKGGKLVRSRLVFPTTSFASWSLLQSFLHTIGKIAVRMGAYYCNSDGYIFKSSGNWQEFLGFLDENGFNWEIKAWGAGEIRGIGQYQIGGLQTKRLAKGRPLDSLDRIDASVLQLRRSILKENNHATFNKTGFCGTSRSSEIPF